MEHSPAIAITITPIPPFGCRDSEDSPEGLASPPVSVLPTHRQANAATDWMYPINSAHNLDIALRSG